VFSDV
jgi:hypothetical protein